MAEIGSIKRDCIVKALKILFIGVIISSNLIAGDKSVARNKTLRISYLSQKKIEQLEHLIFKNILKLNRAKTDKNSRLISYYKKRIIKDVTVLQSYGEIIELPQLD